MVEFCVDAFWNGVMKLRTLVFAGVAGLMFSAPLLASFQYEGERNAFNRFHGQGKFTSTQGVVYEGSWVDGRREGQGVETKPDGERYEGGWANNRENGKGKKTWPNGDSYDGQWLAGKMQGTGTYVKASGERYQGGFANDERSGKGVLTTPAGDQYEGSWKAGKRTGEFKVRLKDGSVATGQWVDDRAPGVASVDLPDGTRYNGPVRNGVQPNGKGTCTKAGKSNPCEYRDGKPLEVAVVVPPPKPEPKPVAKPAAKVAAPAAAAAAVALAPKAEEAKPAEPVKPRDPRTLRGVRPDGTQFFFRHSFGGSGISDNLANLKVEMDLNEFGAMRITASGGEYSVTMMVDEYVGASTYELKYFKASIEKKGDQTYRTSAAEPGKLVILTDDGKKLTGLFSFTGYPNGNVGPDKRTVAEGEFAISY